MTWAFPPSPLSSLLTYVPHTLGLQDRDPFYSYVCTHSLVCSDSFLGDEMESKVIKVLYLAILVLLCYQLMVIEIK